MGLAIVATVLYSSGEQNAAFSYIILGFYTYIRGLIHGSGRGFRMEGNCSVKTFSIRFLWTALMSKSLAEITTSRRSREMLVKMT